MPQVVFSMNIALDIIPFELVLPSSRPAHPVALIPHCSTDSKLNNSRITLLAFEKGRCPANLRPSSHQSAASSPQLGSLCLPCCAKRAGGGYVPRSKRERVCTSPSGGEPSRGQRVWAADFALVGGTGDEQPRRKSLPRRGLFGSRTGVSLLSF